LLLPWVADYLFDSIFKLIHTDLKNARFRWYPLNPRRDP
jgi:hypothetical protein